jgi:hypothetical protein
MVATEAHALGCYGPASLAGGLGLGSAAPGIGEITEPDPWDLMGLEGAEVIWLPWHAHIVMSDRE